MRAFFGIFVMLVFSTAAWSKTCLDVSPEILRVRDGKSVVVTWKFFRHPAENPVEAFPPRLLEYQTRYRSALKMNARDLIRRSQDFRSDTVKRIEIEGVTPSNQEMYLALQSGNQNSERILNGNIGLIRPLSCIEAWIFDEFLEQFSQKVVNLEFSAAIYQKNDQITVLASFDPSYVLWGRPSRLQTISHVNLLSTGWSYKAHLHNHPFLFAPQELAAQLQLGGILTRVRQTSRIGCAKNLRAQS